MGGWSEALGSRAKSERRSAVRYAGDKAASAEALRIIHIQVVGAAISASAPDPVSWPRFRSALEQVDEAKIRRRVLRDLAAEVVEATSPQSWRLGAPAKKVLRLKVRGTAVAQVSSGARKPRADGPRLQGQGQPQPKRYR